MVEIHVHYSTNDVLIFINSSSSSLVIGSVFFTKKNSEFFDSSLNYSTLKLCTKKSNSIVPGHQIGYEEDTKSSVSLWKTPADDLDERYFHIFCSHIHFIYNPTFERSRKKMKKITMFRLHRSKSHRVTNSQINRRPEPQTCTWWHLFRSQ